MRVQVVPDFFSRAEDLRAHFEKSVQPTRAGDRERFIWDYWHIPDQYTYLRTVALNVFPPSLLAEFTAALSTWGGEHLGTRRVQMPWLSFYVDGCRQELHSDVVQGTWSYVYSLTRWEDRVFTGGETMLGTPLLLDYWNRLDAGRSTEARHLVERVPAPFDQLCVFDSRLPHGVSTVLGTRDPLKARVALHGWFHPPEVDVQGALTKEQVEAAVVPLYEWWTGRHSDPGGLFGLSVWRVETASDGAVTNATVIVDNLVQRGQQWEADEELAELEAQLLNLRFPSAGGPSTVTVPVGRG